MNDSNKKFTLWNNKIGGVINALGTEDFPQQLFEAIESVIPDIFVIVFAMPKNQPPQHLFDNYPERIREINTSEWISGAYLLDPLYIKCFDGSSEGLYHLPELVPEGLMASEYYKLYFSLTHCIDEASFLSHINSDLRVSFSLARLDNVDSFNNDELECFQAISPMVMSALKKHFQQVEITENKKQAQLHNKLKAGLEEFGTFILTSREQDMIQLILHGHSSKSISSKLNISLDTVKMHRRNAYSKLKVSSQAELFSLVFESLPYIESQPGKDPLQLYLSQESKAGS